MFVMICLWWDVCDEMFVMWCLWDVCDEMFVMRGLWWEVCDERFVMRCLWDVCDEMFLMRWLWWIVLFVTPSSIVMRCECFDGAVLIIIFHFPVFYFLTLLLGFTASFTILDIDSTLGLELKEILVPLWEAKHNCKYNQKEFLFNEKYASFLLLLLLLFSFSFKFLISVFFAPVSNLSSYFVEWRTSRTWKIAVPNLRRAC
jgi:hypothetical protein